MAKRNQECEQKQADWGGHDEAVVRWSGVNRQSVQARDVLKKASCKTMTKKSAQTRLHSKRKKGQLKGRKGRPWTMRTALKHDDAVRHESQREQHFREMCEDVCGNRRMQAQVAEN